MKTRWLLAMGVAAAASVAHASERGEVCATSAEQGERLRDEHKLLAARKAFLSCSQSDCPDFVKRDCAKWYEQLAQSIPTIVVEARDAERHDVPGARLTIDGVIVREHLDGLPIEVDPGEHTLTIDAPGFTTYSEHVLVAESERGRVVPLRIARPVAHETRHRMPGWIPWTVGLFGVAALGGFAAAEIVGQNDYSSLRAQCGDAHTCTPGQVSATRTDFILAAVSLGVGILAVGTATILFIVRGHDDRADTAMLGIRGTF